MYFCYHCSVTQSCPTLCNPKDCRTPGLSVSHHLPKLAQVHAIASVITSSHFILTASSPSAFNHSQHQELFKWVSCLHHMTKILEFQCHHSNEYSGLISLNIDWFDLLPFQGTLKSLLQHHSSKASILWCSTFFEVQLSQL